MIGDVTDSVMWLHVIYGTETNFDDVIKNWKRCHQLLIVSLTWETNKFFKNENINNKMVVKVWPRFKNESFVHTQKLQRDVVLTWKCPFRKLCSVAQSLNSIPQVVLELQKNFVHGSGVQLWTCLCQLGEIFWFLTHDDVNILFPTNSLTRELEFTPRTRKPKR